MTPPLEADLLAALADIMAEDGSLPDPSTLPPAEGRALASQMNRRWNQDLPFMAAVTRHDLPDTPDSPHSPAEYWAFRPENAKPGAIFFVHGGGWAFCDIATHERAIRSLAVETGVTVIATEYRLAPEHAFPAGLTDCVAVWRQVLASRDDLDIGDGPVAIAGDSAGANLALSLMIHEHQQLRPLPDAGLLFYGAFDADFETPSYRQMAEGPGLTRDKMRRYWDWYAPAKADRENPLVAPLRATDEMLRALPPLYLNAAQVDPLRSDTERLAKRLKALGHHHEFTLFEGVVHGFMQMTSRVDAARAATRDAARAFNELTSN